MPKDNSAKLRIALATQEKGKSQQLLQSYNDYLPLDLVRAIMKDEGQNDDLKCSAFLYLIAWDDLSNLKEMYRYLTRDYVTEDGWHATAVAIRTHRLDVLEWLLSRGFSLTADDKRLDPVMVAIRFGHLALLKTLTTPPSLFEKIFGSDRVFYNLPVIETQPSSPSLYGPFFEAIHYNHLDIFQHLIHPKHLGGLGLYKSPDMIRLLTKLYSADIYTWFFIHYLDALLSKHLYESAIAWVDATLQENFMHEKIIPSIILRFERLLMTALEADQLELAQTFRNVLENIQPNSGDLVIAKRYALSNQWLEMYECYIRIYNCKLSSAAQRETVGFELANLIFSGNIALDMMGNPQEAALVQPLLRRTIIAYEYILKGISIEAVHLRRCFNEILAGNVMGITANRSKYMEAWTTEAMSNYKEYYANKNPNMLFSVPYRQSMVLTMQNATGKSSCEASSSSVSTVSLFNPPKERKTTPHPSGGCVIS